MSNIKIELDIRDYTRPKIEEILRNPDYMAKDEQCEAILDIIEDCCEKGCISSLYVPTTVTSNKMEVFYSSKDNVKDL